MMGFRVQPEWIAKYADVIRAQSGHAGKAHDYADQHLSMTWPEQGLLSYWWGPHDRLHAAAANHMADLAKVCDMSQGQLQTAVAYYQRADQTSAQKFDDALPGIEVADTGPPVNPALTYVYERNAPEGRLNPPGRPEEFHNPLEPINAISNWLSPGWWINEVLDQTINCNPKDAVAQLLLGDWEAFARCGGALNALAFFCRDVADNVRLNVDNLMSTWQGHAAQAAQSYFMTLAGAVRGHQEAFERLRDAYHGQAHGAWEFSEAAGDIIQGIFDTIFWMGVECIAGFLFSETGVVEVAVWSVAAFQCKMIVDDWKRVTKLIDEVQHTAMSSAGAVTEVVTMPGGLGVLPVPAAGYSAPAGMAG
jgi:hypothetical protein